jgi:hypothetical protein
MKVSLDDRPALATVSHGLTSSPRGERGNA